MRYDLYHKLMSVSDGSHGGFPEQPTDPIELVALDIDGTLVRNDDCQVLDF